MKVKIEITMDVENEDEAYLVERSIEKHLDYSYEDKNYGIKRYTI